MSLPCSVYHHQHKQDVEDQIPSSHQILLVWKREPSPKIQEEILTTEDDALISVHIIIYKVSRYSTDENYGTHRLALWITLTI